MVDKLAMGNFSFQAVGLFLPIIVPPLLQTPFSSAGDIIGPFEAIVPSSSTLPQFYQNGTYFS
jgi:hypothetical protein